MKPNAHPARSFKENLKRMLLLYALTPVILLLTVCTVITICAGGVFLANKNHSVNRTISNEMQSILECCQKLAAELTSFPDITDDRMSLTRRQLIVRQIYSASVQTGYSLQLYVTDNDGQVLMSTPEDDTRELKKVSSAICDSPEGSAVHVVTLGGKKKIYAGSRILQNGESAGYVLLALPEEEFFELLSSGNHSNILVDDTGWVFAANSYSFTDAVGRLKPPLKERSGFFTMDNGSFFCGFTPILDGKLTVYTITDNTDIVIALQTVLATCFVVLAAIMALCFLSAERMTERSTSDISKINDAFAKVGDGNLNAYLDIHSSAEFESIGSFYNEMLDSLKRQIAANKEMAQTVADTQVKQLKSQFNSHFLFNTLDNIRFMCKIDADLAESMTVSLSELLRYNTSSANEHVTVQEDLKYIGIYLKIMKVRFGERLDYSLDISPDACDFLIPKLLMQPIIENAIKYGFGDRESLKIQVRVFEKDGLLTLLCEDNGVGMQNHQLKKLMHNLSLPENEGAHLGLHNVNRRIRLIYGEGYGLFIESRDGVQVKLLLPAKREESGAILC